MVSVFANSGCYLRLLGREAYFCEPVDPLILQEEFCD